MKLKLTTDIYIDHYAITTPEGTVFTVKGIQDNMLVVHFFDGRLKTFVALDECDTIEQVKNA